MELQPQPSPFPKPPNPLLPLPQQQQRRRRMMIQLHPPLSEHPPPQPVAVKSLMKTSILSWFIDRELYLQFHTMSLCLDSFRIFSEKWDKMDPAAYYNINPEYWRRDLHNIWSCHYIMICWVWFPGIDWRQYEILLLWNGKKKRINAVRTGDRKSSKQKQGWWSGHRGGYDLWDRPGMWGLSSENYEGAMVSGEWEKAGDCMNSKWLSDRTKSCRNRQKATRKRVAPQLESRQDNLPGLDGWRAVRSRFHSSTG